MGDYETAMYKFERALLIGALVMTKGNICRAATNAGLHRNTLQRKIKHFKLAAAVSDIKKGTFRAGVAAAPSPGKIQAQAEARTVPAQRGA